MAATVGPRSKTRSQGVLARLSRRNGGRAAKTVCLLARGASGTSVQPRGPPHLVNHEKIILLGPRIVSRSRSDGALSERVCRVRMKRFERRAFTEAGGILTRAKRDFCCAFRTGRNDLRSTERLPPRDGHVCYRENTTPPITLPVLEDKAAENCTVKIAG